MMENQNTTKEMLTISRFDYEEECTKFFLSGYYRAIKDAAKVASQSETNTQVPEDTSKNGSAAAVIICLGLPFAIVGAAMMATRSSRKKDKAPNRN